MFQEVAIHCGKKLQLGEQLMSISAFVMNDSYEPILATIYIGVINLDAFREQHSFQREFGQKNTLFCSQILFSLSSIA